jgi:hypothetical protein
MSWSDFYINDVSSWSQDPIQCSWVTTSALRELITLQIAVKKSKCVFNNKNIFVYYVKHSGLPTTTSRTNPTTVTYNAMSSLGSAFQKTKIFSSTSKKRSSLLQRCRSSCKLGSRRVGSWLRKFQPLSSSIITGMSKNGSSRPLRILDGWK